MEKAKFAYHCDKLECDIQMKLYDRECHIMQITKVKKY